MSSPLRIVAALVLALTAALGGLTAIPTRAQTATIICIDPGHGGSDTGTSGGGILEKQLNLAVAVRLGDVLGANGHGYSFTRQSDLGLSNTQRAQACNAAGATVLISVHHNGGKSATTDYSTALYQKRVDKALARAIVAAVAPVTSGVNNGIMQFASAVLIKSDMPATISEGYFLTNPTEQARLTDFARAPSDPRTTCGYCDQEAQALAAGIATYLG